METHHITKKYRVTIGFPDDPDDYHDDVWAVDTKDAKRKTKTKYATYAPDMYIISVKLIKDVAKAEKRVLGKTLRRR